MLWTGSTSDATGLSRRPAAIPTAPASSRPRGRMAATRRQRRGSELSPPNVCGRGRRYTMDTQGTMRLMFDTMDAYDRADFDRLAEIYAEDAQWLNADPDGPHCRNRDDIFTMFRQRMSAGVRIQLH